MKVLFTVSGYERETMKKALRYVYDLWGDTLVSYDNLETKDDDCGRVIIVDATFDVDDRTLARYLAKVILALRYEDIAVQTLLVRWTNSKMTEYTEPALESCIKNTPSSIFDEVEPGLTELLLRGRCGE